MRNHFLLIFVLSLSGMISGMKINQKSKDWCSDSEDYFVEHCPIQKGDYDGCCLCTQVII